MNEMWENIIRTVFSEKPSIVLELLKYTKIYEYDSYNKVLKIRILKNYIEKIILSKLPHIKREFEKYLEKQIIQINLNNKIYKFEYSKNLNLKNNTKTIINEDRLSGFYLSKTVEQKNNTTKDEQRLKDEFISKINKRQSISLLFYNNLLFSNKKIDVTIVNYNYRNNLILAIKYGWLIIPGIYYLIKFFIYKYRWNKTKNNIDDVLKMKYQPINKETSDFLNYCLDYYHVIINN